MNKASIKTLFIDYDGTLHDSLAIYKPAFLKAYKYLVDHHHAPFYAWRSEEISQFLGQTPKEMWASFGPNISDEAKQKASHIISEEMKRLIDDNQAVLYEGALETLRYLKSKGYQLVFISNCKKYYMEAHANQFNLHEIFDGMVCSESFDVSEKHQVLAHILDDYEPEYAIIGDRHHDIEAGKYNQIYTIGCAYGFAQAKELDNADLIINDITDLVTLF